MAGEDILQGLGESTDLLGDLNAALNPLLDAPDLVQSQLRQALPGLDSCLGELLASLAFAQSSGLTDSGTQRFLLEALRTPFKEFGESLSELFVPDEQALEAVEPGFRPYFAEFVKQLGASLANPFSAIVDQQRTVFSASVDQIGRLLFSEPQSDANGRPKENTGGYLREAYDRIVSITQQVVTLGEDGAGLGGMLIYAVTETIPAIEDEIRYLQRMRRAVRTTLEVGSTLPPSMLPQLTNISTSNLLCEAEHDLSAVARQLRTDRTLDRARLSAAGEKVCDARDVIASGGVTDAVAGQLRNFLGWDDRQINAIKRLKIMPDPAFRLATIELQALLGYVKLVDPQIQNFHTNLTSLVETLRSLTSLHVAPLFALLIEGLRNQIAAVRTDLEAQGAGFTGNLPASIPDSVLSPTGQAQVVSSPPRRIAGLPESVAAVRGPTQQGILRRNAKYAVDVYAHLSSQATAYVVLSGACFLLTQLRTIYRSLEKAFEFNTRIMKLVRSFVDGYLQAQCDPGEGVEGIERSVNAFLRAAEERLRGGTNSLDGMNRRAEDLIQQLQNRERYLQCIKDTLTFNNSAAGRVLTTIANVYQTAQNIKRVARTVSSLRQALREFDLKRIFGIDGARVNAVDAILRALQCLVLQCNNPALTLLLQQARDELGRAGQEASAGLLTLGALDAGPKTAATAALNTRVAALLRLVASIQRLTSFDLNELCNIPTAPTPASGQVPNPPAEVRPPPVRVIDRRSQLLLAEQQSARDAASATTPFAPT